jgi:TonB family protein
MMKLRIAAFALIISASLALGAEAILIPPGKAKELVLYAPRPGYPYLARELHETGQGLFVLTVDENTGKVTAIHIEQSTGHKRLDWAAIKAFMLWRFKPHATAPMVKIPITFKITRR